MARLLNYEFLTKSKGQSKGQTQQVFIYLIAIIALGAVILFGYKAIHSLLSKGCAAEKAEFKASLEEMLENYNSFGSLHIETLKAPCSVTEICFVSAEVIGKNALPSTAPALIRDNTEAGVRFNIYLLTNNVVEPLTFSDYVKAPGNYTCIPAVGGVFKIKFEGLGAYTLVSRP